MKGKKTLFAAIALAMLGILALLIGPLDLLRHGATNATIAKMRTYAFSEQTIDAENMILQPIQTVGDYLTGAELYTAGEAGTTVTMRLLRADGTQAASMQQSLFGESGWVMFALKAKCGMGTDWTLEVSADAPVTVRLARAQDVTESGSYMVAQDAPALLTALHYECSTFSVTDKTLILLLLAAVGIAVFSAAAKQQEKTGWRRAALLTFALFLLMWGYLRNPFDASNQAFDSFQHESEELAVSSMNAEYLPDVPNHVYGLLTHSAGETDYTDYLSQVGLQGYVYGFSARLLHTHLSAQQLRALWYIPCSAAMAIVVLLIVWQIYHQFGRLLAGCFFCVMLLSPWVVNFARNLYWVEFTWFLPMLAGLLSLRAEKTKTFAFCTIGAFAAVLLKSLCGYEYISTIMLGLILFPAARWLEAVIGKDRAAAKKHTVRIIALGVAALLGFAAALAIHGMMRGGGNLLAGIKDIYDKDVLRRTLGGSIDAFDESYTDSINASIWSVLCTYFTFPTQVLPGIDANLFPLFAGVPAVFLAVRAFAASIHEAERKQLAQDAMLYLMGGLMALSWFVLAKQHSFVHIHMNYVLWYAGFVPVCLYLWGRMAQKAVGRLSGRIGQ